MEWTREETSDNRKCITRLGVLHALFTHVNILTSAERQIKDVFDPHIVGDVNESQVRVATFGEEFDWHFLTHEDAGFFGFNRSYCD